MTVSSTLSELIVDGFAGGGGASAGIELALGRSPDLAYNHDTEACSMHAINHPLTRHVCRNIMQVDPLAEIGNRPVGLAWFSPDCKHHSKAKGGKPVKRSIRDLAWVVVLWAKRARPRVIMLENVEEFRDWGPLTQRADGEWYPCPDRRGQTFDRWVGELRRLGYKVEWKELRACDYGAPTIRKRLFLIARRDGRPIVWPAPTHGNPKSEAVRSGRLEPWRTAAEIIDWSIPCPSIFLTREEARAVGANRPLAEATMARIAKGVKRYVLDAARPFIVSVAHGHSGGRREYAVEEPLGSQTQSRTHAVVTPFVAPITHSGGKRANDAAEPLRTITTAHRGEHALIAPVLSGCGGRAGQSPPKPLTEPMNTATTKADQILVAPHLTKFRVGAVGSDLNSPTPTVTANSFEKRPGGAAPIGLVAPYLVPRYGERLGQEPRTRSIEEPAPAVVPTGNGGSFVAAFLAQHNAGPRPGVRARSAEEPISTITTAGSQQAIVAAGLVNMKGSEQASRSLDEPAPTVTAGGKHVAEVRAFLMKYYGADQDPRLEEPLHTVTVRDRFGLVMVNGEPYEIVDIGMRMLSPRELFRAQGFPDSYIIDRGIGFDGQEIKLTKTAQVRMCGNSVCPPMAAALVAANYVSNETTQPRRRPAEMSLPFLEAAE